MPYAQGVADDEAQYGLAFLWSAMVSWPLTVSVQATCGFTALAAGDGARSASNPPRP